MSFSLKSSRNKFSKFIIEVWENDTSVIKKVKKRHFCQPPPKKRHFCQTKYTSVNQKDTSVNKRTVLSTKRHLCQLFSKNQFHSCLSETSLLSNKHPNARLFQMRKRQCVNIRRCTNPKSKCRFPICVVQKKKHPRACEIGMIVR